MSVGAGLTDTAASSNLLGSTNTKAKYNLLRFLIIYELPLPHEY